MPQRGTLPQVQHPDQHPEDVDLVDLDVDPDTEATTDQPRHPQGRSVQPRPTVGLAWMGLAWMGPAWMGLAWMGPA